MSFEEVRVEEAGHGFEAVDDAGAGAVDEIGVEGEDVPVYDGVDAAPAGAGGDGLGALAKLGVGEQDNVRVGRRSRLRR